MAKTGSTTAILAWAGFQAGRDPYVILVIIYVFAPYFALHVAGGGAGGQTVVANASTVAGVLAALTAPLLGFATDRFGPRKPLLAVVVALFVPVLAALWWVIPGGIGVLSGATAFVVMGVLFAWTETLHHALLLPAAGAPRAATASGLGLAGGNAMSVTLLLIVLYAFALPGSVPWAWVPPHPLLGLDPSRFEPSRIVGPITALALACGLPGLLLAVPDVPRTGYSFARALRAGWADLRRALAIVSAEPQAARFLLARTIFTDGQTAILVFAGIFAAGIMHWGVLSLLAYGVILSTLAVIGGLVAPLLDNRLGARNAIAVEIVVTVIVLTAITGCNPTHILFVPYDGALHPAWASPVFPTWNELAYVAVAGVSAISITACYASSRTFMARLVPPERAATFFGIYALSGSATAWLGSSLVGIMTALTHSQLGGYAAIDILLLAGLALLFRVRARG